MTNYEEEFQKSSDICGPPFPEILSFFERFDGSQVKVLDLGCGQGRDALPIARMGHSIVGVDVSKTGVTQMVDAAKRESLAVKGEVADISEYIPNENYDVVVLDRVLHMLDGDEQRLSVLDKSSVATLQGGYIVIADTPKQLKSMRVYFGSRSDEWESIKDKNGFLFMKKLDR
jgi:2-polyprenyl-3-methyl-5-hydroxy-6-metoxy-1,4-benzoquinol methylase